MFSGHLRVAFFIDLRLDSGHIRFLCLLELGFRPYGGSLFPRAEKVTKKALLLVWPFLRQGSFTSVSLRGPAPNGHPCPDGALAASMRLGPLRETCVQPAPKSRLAVFGLFAYEDQKQIKSRSQADHKQITSRSKASRLKPVRHVYAVSRTGFSREAFDLLLLCF
jgi:hypothetical protein